QSVVDGLAKDPFLLTLSGTLAFADEVAIADSDWLAEPFGAELNGRLIRCMPEHRPVIDRLNLRSLSSVTALERVRIGEVISDDDAAKLIADRRDLLLWLLSGVRAEGRQRVSEALRSLEIFRSDFIQVRSVFSLTDPPVISSPKSEKVLFEGRTSCLYLHLDLGVSFWVPAFRA